MDLCLDYKDEIKEAINLVVDSNYYINGPILSGFEDNFSRYLGVNHFLGVGGGLDALILALRALDIGPGDEVISPAFSAAYTALAVQHVGATNVLADVTPEGLLDPVSVKKMVTPKTRAIVPVHLFGRAAVVDYYFPHVHVIEDCAQSHGERFPDGTMTGSRGIINTFSFYPTKNLGCFGEGGGVSTNDWTLYERLRALRDGGRVDRYKHEYLGLNSRLDEIQAAVLSVKLGHLDSRNLQRKQHAHIYDMRIRNGVLHDLITPLSSRGVYHLYVVQTESRWQRERIISHLNQRNISTLIHYPHLVHRHPFFEGRVSTAPQSRHLSDTVLSLPFYPLMPEEEQDDTIDALTSFFQTPKKRSNK